MDPHGDRPPRPPRLGRTLLVLAPIHLVVFLSLYLGLLALVRREVRISHAESARVLADVVVEDLHPLMISALPREIHAGLTRFSAAHSLVSLGLFDEKGVPLTRAGPPDPAVAAFLASPDHGQFELRPANPGWTLHGIVAVRSVGACTSCHPDGSLLGAAVIGYDVSATMSAAQSRLARGLGGVVLAWLGLVAALAVATRGAVRRTVERLRAEANAADGGAALPGVPRLVLDPVSAELYASLRDVLRSQRERDEQVASRLSHTDRLASLGQLAAGLAHEIKNPVAGLQGALEILRDETGEEPRRELYEQMIAETRRVNATVQSLLHFARPSRPQRVATDVPELLGDLARLMAPGLRRRQIALDVEAAPGLPAFALDPAQIRQVLVNLVNNAAEAMEQGGGRVVLRAAALPEQGGLILAVEDDGPGIPADTAARIFEPFFTTKHYGTGLGLAVARSLVAQHGGRVELRTAPGEGTSFLIVLPTAASPAPREG